jgi:hypothetical protein
LEIIFNTGHYSKRQTKRPAITTNEGPETKYVQIVCDVYTNPDSTYPISIMPYKFDISQYGEKERSSLEFNVKNLSDQDLDMTLVDMPAGMFKITLPKKIKAGQTGKGKIELLKDQIKKEFEKSVTFQVNDKLNSRFTVPVKRTIRIPGANPTDTTTAKK